MNVSESYIPRKLPVIALICTLFITYPNILWILWNLARRQKVKSAVSGFSLLSGWCIPTGFSISSCGITSGG